MSQSFPSAEAREFPARFAAVADTAAFALDFCGRHGIERPAAQRLRLVIEELFTNSIQHGYRGECDTPIRIELAMIEGHVTVQYEDSAPQYDPLAQLSTLSAPAATSLDAATAGGLGIYLVGKSAYGADYTREDGRNRLRLVMPR
ncbi:MAG: ATP-binding protein [Burkholderiales bacterium]